MVAKIRWKPLIVNLAIAFGVEAVSALATRDSMQVYQTLQKPPMSPPGAVFGIVWSVLFFLMGISAYRVYQSGAPGTKRALTVYGVQLLVNFLWSIFFFNLQAYWFAFVWLVFLWVLVLWMSILFFHADRTAGLLQIPYLIWLTFSGYLSFGVALLN